MTTKKKWASWMMALVAVVALSTTAPVGRAAIQAGTNLITLLVGRFILAWFLLTIAQKAAPPGWLGSNGPRVAGKGLWLCITAGLGHGIATLSYFVSLSRINASITSMLMSLYPLLVLILLALRGEQITWLKLIRLGLGIGGAYLLLGPGGELDVLGASIVLFGAVCFAFQMVITQWYLHIYPARVVTQYVIAVTTAVMVAVWLATGASWYIPVWQGWLAGYGCAGCCEHLPRRLALFATVRHIGSAQMALLAPLETLLVIVWSVLFLQEKLTVHQWIGGGLIICSAMLAMVRTRKSVPLVRRAF